MLSLCVPIHVVSAAVLKSYLLDRQHLKKLILVPFAPLIICYRARVISSATANSSLLSSYELRNALYPLSYSGEKDLCW